MILLRKAKIFDVRSRHHLKTSDVLIEKGIITRIAKNIRPDKKTKVVESKSLCISPGWLDIGCFNGEPGFEYREDLESLAQAAQQGGYCRIAPFPTGSPTLDSKGQLAYFKAATTDFVVDFVPIASVTKDRSGIDLAELLDLHNTGAQAFSDGLEDRMSGPQILRCLLYLKTPNALSIFNTCPTGTGHMHEGAISVQMGLEGMPEHLEEERINLITKQSEYAGARILFHNISTTGCLKEISKSTNSGLITTSVAFLNLVKSDEDVLDFDLNLKTVPPLRNNKKALSKAVESGQVNIITSNHNPRSIEEKDQPFGLSDFGASTLDTVFPALNTYSKGISLERIIHCLSIGPHDTLGLDCPIIAKGSEAVLTVFDPSKSTQFSPESLKSKSKNNPFVDEKLTGQVLGIVNGRKSTI